MQFTHQFRYLLLALSVKRFQLLAVDDCRHLHERQHQPILFSAQTAPRSASSGNSRFTLANERR
jgi:hypothetical protein